MKQKISITIEEDVLMTLDKRVATGTFRNKSHFFEYAARLLLSKGKQGGEQ